MELPTERVEIDDGRRLTPVVPGRIQNIYQTLIDAHARSVLDGNPLDADAAVHNLALCAAVHRSARQNGRIVSVRD